MRFGQWKTNSILREKIDRNAKYIWFHASSLGEFEQGRPMIEKIKAAIIIAVKKNYEVEEDHVKVDIDPAAGRFDVALIQDVVADEDWYLSLIHI